MRITLPEPMEAARPILTTLAQNGHEAVFVGGSVRDTLLGLPIKDVDIATSALPEETMALFPRVVATGLQHGTVTVLHEHETYEVTTYRHESDYDGFRRPKSVSFIRELAGDLLRRDFTVNAMAIREDGGLIDPCGGLSDLKLSILRCVGDADDRFREDALRMLRAVRFLSLYRLRPALSAWRSLKRHSGLLRHIAMERVQAELDKMLGSDRPDAALVWVRASGLLQHTKEPLPVWVEAFANPRAAESIAAAASALNKLELDERWGALLLGLRCGMQQAEQTLRALRFSGKRLAAIGAVLRLHEQLTAIDAAGLKAADPAERWIGAVLQHGEPAARQWLAIARAMPAVEAAASDIGNAATLGRLLDHMPAKSLKELAVGGSQLTRHLGKAAGPWVSALLRRLLREAASGRLRNEQAELLAQAKIWNNEDEGKTNE